MIAAANGVRYAEAAYNFTGQPGAPDRKVNWWRTTDPAATIDSSNEWGHLLYSFHDGGANVAMADGSVRLLSDGTSLYTVAVMCTRSGGEVVPE